MAATVFCEHKKLRTSCPLCKASAVPPPAPELRPVIEAPPPRKPRAAPAEGDEPAAERKAPKEPGLRGPGKPLMPTRQKPKRVDSRAEAEHADAWWVKKG